MPKLINSNIKLLAVDPSLTCSGWALFGCVKSELQQGKLLAVGKVKSLPTSFKLPERYKDLQNKISNIFEQLQLAKDDVLVCESPTTMRDPGAAFKVEQVRGIFETVARSKGLAVPGRINPRTVQSQIMGLKGKQLERSIVKRTASVLVQSLYKMELSEMGFDVTLANLTRNQDIVDAILVGSMALSKLRFANYGELTLEDSFLASESRRGKLCRR